MTDQVDRAPKVGDKVAYWSLGQCKPYEAKITRVYRPDDLNSPVDLVAYNPADRDEIWKAMVPRGESRGRWSWPPPPDPEAKKK